MKRSITKIAIFIGFTVFLVLPVLCSLLKFPRHRFSKFGKDSPADFNLFLNSCTDIERIYMLQALQQLPSGFLSTNYNNAKPEDVIKAVRAGKINSSEISPSAIRKALVWRSYNKATYMFRSDDEVDYHDIVKWAADNLEITSQQISNFSTYQLEKEVSRKFFSKIWDSLTYKQKETMLHDLKLKRTWRLDIIDTAQKIFDLITDPKALIVGILSSTVGYAFAESDTVCMFIMTVSMIKSK